MSPSISKRSRFADCVSSHPSPPTWQIPTRYAGSHAPGASRTPPHEIPVRIGRRSSGSRGHRFDSGCRGTPKPPQRARWLRALEALSAPRVRWGRISSLEICRDFRVGGLEVSCTKCRRYPKVHNFRHEHSRHPPLTVPPMQHIAYVRSCLTRGPCTVRTFFTKPCNRPESSMTIANATHFADASLAVACTHRAQSGQGSL